MRSRILLDPMAVIDAKLENFMFTENKCTITIGTKIYCSINSLAPFKSVFVKIDDSTVGDVISEIYFDLEPKINYDEDDDE